MARIHPEPHDFLMAAGAIDRVDTDAPELQHTVAALTHLTRMIGSYQQLHPGFRADMRLALRCKDDAHVKRTCAAITDNCGRLTLLSDSDRTMLRRRFSELSKFWPVKPGMVLPRP